MTRATCPLFILLASLAWVTTSANEPSHKNNEAYTPATTSVAVLFAPNFSDDKWKQQKEKESKTARDYAYKLFNACGFKSIPVDKVDGAVSSAGIDLQKEDQWTKANFYKIGKDVGANLVAFVMIKQTRQKLNSTFLTSQEVGEAEIEVWLVDAQKETALISDQPARGSSNSGARASSPRRCRAVEFAVKSGYGQFLKDYPSDKRKSKN